MPTSLLQAASAAPLAAGGATGASQTCRAAETLGVQGKETLNLKASCTVLEEWVLIYSELMGPWTT